MSKGKKRPEKPGQHDLPAKADDPQPTKPSQPSELPSGSPSIPEIAGLIASGYSRTQFSGPIPPPEVLRGYNEIIPDGAERILQMAERQAAHRQQLEAQVICPDNFRAKAGLWIGAGIATLSIGVGGWLAYLGHDWAGTVIATAVVVSLVGVFVYGSASRRQERSGKAPMPMGPASPISSGSQQPPTEG